MTVVFCFWRARTPYTPKFIYRPTMLPPRQQDTTADRSNSRSETESNMDRGEEAANVFEMGPAGSKETDNIVLDQLAAAASMDQGQHDEWAAVTEGYTPLADLGISGTGQGGSVFMAFPPNHGNDDDDSDFDDSDNGGGVFFADMQAFRTEIELEEGAAGKDVDELPEPVEEQLKAPTEKVDFIALANQALSALDLEYAETLQVGGQPPQSRTDTGTSTSNTTDNGSIADMNTNLFDDIKRDGKLDTINAIMLPADDAKEKVPLSTTNEPPRELPDIDADAVRRAVQNIRLQAPKFTTNIDQQCSSVQQQQQHSIIPSAPLSAFRKRTPKAVRATANLSRSATLTEALCRLSSFPYDHSDSLVIHVIGADLVECESVDMTKILFGPFCRWVGAQLTTTTTTTMPKKLKHIRIYLNGPNLPRDAASRPPVDLLPRQQSRPPPTSGGAISDNSNSKSGLESATAFYVNGLYHEWMIPGTMEQQPYKWEAPNFCIAFNAGVWGYCDWHPTIQAMNMAQIIMPFIITSYTLEEAEDDANAMEDLLTSSHADNDQCLWKPELNPFGSNQKRETRTAPKDRIYRENAAWQAWRLGGNCFVA